jgi:dihydrodipicolinate reductase
MNPEPVIIGAAGRMGRHIVSLSIDAGWFDFIAAVERKGRPDINRDALRQEGAIGMHSVRGGDITGIHLVVVSWYTRRDSSTEPRRPQQRHFWLRRSSGCKVTCWQRVRPLFMYSMTDVLDIRRSFISCPVHCLSYSRLLRQRLRRSMSIRYHRL